MRRGKAPGLVTRPGRRPNANPRTLEQEFNQPSWYSRVMLDTWAWEVGAAVVCLGVVITIAGLLFGYNNSPVPDLPDELNINAIIALLATVAKSSLLVVLAAALRQEKWLWLVGRSQPLTDIDAFEDASRGPYGSLELIFYRLGGYRAKTLAIVTVLTLGFELFVQQLVSIDIENIAAPGRVATIRTPISYNETVTSSLAGSELSLNALIGALGGAGGVVPNPVCESGNCTWPDYNTFALCTVCQDMTDLVTVEDPVTLDISQLAQEYIDDGNTSTTVYHYFSPRYSFPRGNTLNATMSVDLVGQDPLQWTVSFPRRVAWPLNIASTVDSSWQDTWDNNTYAGLNGPLFAMGYLDLNISSDYSTIVTQRATQCAFTPCVRTLRSTVSGGQANHEVLDTNYGSIHILVNHDDGTLTSGWTANVNGTEYSITERGTNNIQGHPFLLIQALRMALEGNTTYLFGGYWYGDNNEQNAEYNQTTYDQDSGPWTSPGQQAIDSNGNFTDVVDGVGRALTGRFQNLQTSVVEGTVLVSVAMLHVRWAWIAYPLSIVVLGVWGWIMTMDSTRRKGMALWKQSSLPLLYRIRGQSGDHGWKTPVEAVPKPNLVSYMAEEAERETVKLEKNDDVWMLDFAAPAQNHGWSAVQLQTPRGTR